MAYDAAEHLEAVERPAITLPKRWPFRGVRTFRGRVLSIEEWMPFAPRFAVYAAGALEPEEVERLWYDFMLALELPAGRVLRLPPVVVAEAVADFLACQERALTPAASVPANDGEAVPDEPPPDT